MSATTLNFQTEAKKLLQIMINSLYSNREVFLRELISNASDAIDKLRVEALQDANLSADDSDFKICVDFDSDAKTITISDNGIGMTRDEVVENLGTIAKSGTEAFLEQLTGDQQKDANLIGQFGVGFYSVFMVAEEVVVFTRKAGTEQGTRWFSQGEDAFSVEDAEADRGTKIVVKLKTDAEEYADGWKLREIVRRYSDHIGVPVEMESFAGDDEEKTRETINSAQAIWTRSRSDIRDDEYKEFYKHVSHDFEDPFAWSHNRVEGRLEYTSLMYIPKRAPFDLWNSQVPRGLKLYVQRVFIMDEAETFLPLYLRWVKGVVDSSDLPLNVSREMLQESIAVQTIRNALAKRVLDRLGKMATEEPDQYGEFWDEFGSVLKEGAGPDNPNRDNLLKLFRFTTTKDAVDESTGTAKQRTSFADYISRASDSQEKIYYLTGDSESALRESPHLEIFKKNNIEVILLAEPVDAWMMSFLDKFDDYEIKDITRGELDLPESDSTTSASNADETKVDDDKTDDSLLSRMKEVLDEKVEDVRKSERLTESPACLVLGEYDMNPQMRRIMQASGQTMPTSKPALEVNVDHTLVKHLDSEADEDRFVDMVHMLYEQAALSDGSIAIETGSHVKRVNRLLETLLR